MNEIITVDGEVVPTPADGESLAVRLQRAEIDQQIATARAYPRDLRLVVKRLMEVVSLSEDVAASMLYRLPRADKDIEGPSIRFAEALFQAYGNCRVDARVTEVNRAERYVEAEGFFLDLETNAATKKRVRRRISDKKGRLFNDDMIILAGNAGCSIATRKAILESISRAIWYPAYESVLKIVAGRPDELPQRLARALAWFATKGATEAQVMEALKLSDKSEVTQEHLISLTGMRSALMNGEATLEELFGQPHAGHVMIENPLDDSPPTQGKRSK